MIDTIYFFIHNNMRPTYTKISLMGIIMFYKSFKKHLKRRSPHWILKNQLRGMLMCTKQLIKGAVGKK